MTTEYRIDVQRCKGCALCIIICPKDVLEVSAHVNHNGYFPVARAYPEKCVYCALCCTMCPDVALTIQENEQTNETWNPSVIDISSELDSSKYKDLKKAIDNYFQRERKAYCENK